MLKRLKRNKLPLFLLALVMMLSIYYVTLDDESDIEAPVGNLEGNVVSRYQEFAEERLAILSSRDETVNSLEAKISEASVSVNDVENYIQEIEKITSLTEQEVYLESLITDMGYDDALVYLKEANNLTISVLTDNFTVDDYIAIAKTAKTEFGNQTLVTVNVVTDSE